MAVVVPLVIAAQGYATLAAVTAIAFQVTGINDKINKAAANVFGEDLVKVGNIVGMVYGAYSSGAFGFDSVGEAASSGVEALNGYDVMSDAADAANLASTGGQVIADTMTTPYDPTPASMEGFDVTTNVSGPAVEAPASDAISSSTSLADIQKPGAPVMSTTQVADAPKFEMSGAAAERVPTAADYAQGGPSTGVYGSNVTDAGPGFFDKLTGKLEKLVIDPKTGNITNGALQMGGNILQGAFGGYSAAKAREQQQAQYEAAVARQARLANLGTAGWRQTQ